MTVQPAGNAVTTWDDLDDGMGDVTGADLSIPRLNIVHKKGLFKDSSTGYEFQVLNAIFLGVVKQRIMWDSTVDDNDKPQCKSNDFNLGFPQMRTDVPLSKQFPWNESNFSKSDVTTDEDGTSTLPCESCNLKEWTKRGNKSVKPPCSEQWTIPLFYFLEDDETPHPGIIGFQRSGAKPAKIYAGSFKAQRQPMFTVMTTVTLTSESRGSVDYCVPVFKRGAQTSSDLWREYSETGRGIREMLHQAPRGEDSSDDEEAAAPAPTKAATAPTPPKAPAPPRRPPSAVVATKLEEDDPWEAAPAKADAEDDLPF